MFFEPIRSSLNDIVEGATRLLRIWCSGTSPDAPVRGSYSSCSGLGMAPLMLRFAWCSGSVLRFFTQNFSSCSGLRSHASCSGLWIALSCSGSAGAPVRAGAPVHLVLRFGVKAKAAQLRCVLDAPPGLRALRRCAIAARLTTSVLRQYTGVRCQLTRAECASFLCMPQRSAAMSVLFFKSLGP